MNVDNREIPNGIVRFVCPKCHGEGGYEVVTGYRQYGWGYGDCEETWESRTCDECHGDGFYEVDYSPVERPDFNSEVAR